MNLLNTASKQHPVQNRGFGFVSVLLAALILSSLFISHTAQAAITAKTYDGAWAGKLDDGLGIVRVVLILR